MNPAFLSSLKGKVFDCRLVKSGTVADVWRISLGSGIYCIKHYIDSYAPLRQQAELNDLQILSQVIPDSIPAIHKELASKCDAIVLCLDWIGSSQSSNQYHQSSAGVLARLHQRKADFAGLHYVNYIGELTQFNEPGKHWPTFWVESMLSHQLKLAVENGVLKSDELKLIDSYISKAADYLPELSYFSLLHGDLWSGNVLRDQDRKIFLIDPAVYYGDPWVDLAMTELFGGFGKQFYEEYFELNPLDKEGKELIPHYQLYYLMVHLNMFGRSYYPDIEGILKRYK